MVLLLLGSVVVIIHKQNQAEEDFVKSRSKYFDVKAPSTFQ
jgi:hypothetical protein